MTDAGPVPPIDASPPEPDPVPFCQMECYDESDCVTPIPAFDSDNYACEEGLCQYLGCRSDEECRSTFMRSDYACRGLVGGLPTCVQTCTTSSSCGLGGSPAYDSDNYECDDNVCRYLGCNDDFECQQSLYNSAYVCREVAAYNLGIPVPSSLKNCVLSCRVNTDCIVAANGAFDGDNYTCDEGICMYVGCNNDHECATSFSSSRYVCR